MPDFWTLVIAKDPICPRMPDLWTLVIANDPIRPRMPDFWTLVIANDPEGKVMRRSAIASRLRV